MRGPTRTASFESPLRPPPLVPLLASIRMVLSLLRTVPRSKRPFRFRFTCSEELKARRSLTFSSQIVGFCLCSAPTYPPTHTSSGRPATHNPPSPASLLLPALDLEFLTTAPYSSRPLSPPPSTPSFPELSSHSSRLRRRPRPPPGAVASQFTQPLL